MKNKINLVKFRKVGAKQFNKVKKTKLGYDPEADVLRIEISDKPIDYAKEMGNFVVHFNPQGLPVYLEILEAKNFLLLSKRILKKAGVPEFAEKIA